MQVTTTLHLPDGIRIVVPDSLDLITTYVLREQQDWFEDEIKFLRRVLRPGQKIVDIGANYGVYTLTMAARVGAGGQVWAFEPASATARLLGESVAANGFSQVRVVQCAVSRSAGKARLSLNDNAELNALQHGEGAGGPAEMVDLTSLDKARAELGLHGIDFMKIDAEGEEINILLGGTAFFAAESPLIQYEVRVGADPSLELVGAFAELGYQSYRLVPGLNCLVPFEPARPADDFMLNLFCCKPERAAQLEERGFLVRQVPDARLPGAKGRAAFMARLMGGDKYGWRRRLAAMPYAQALAPLWEKTVAGGRSAKAEHALSLYMESRDAGVSMARRFAALQGSLEILSGLCESEPGWLRRASLARVARDYGARGLAVTCLHELSTEILEHKRLDPTEPFLAPGARFDTLAPRQLPGMQSMAEAIGPWVCAAVLEELERGMAFSSFYNGRQSLGNLENIRDLGYASEEMQRRLALVRERFGA